MNELIKPFHGNYPITQLYGENAAAYAHFGIPGHNGIDWGMKEGTIIKPAAPGHILEIKSDPAGYGNYVKISHGDYHSLYAHFREANVIVGQEVDTNTIIGWSGNTGNSTGSHLHFGFKDLQQLDNGFHGYIDPMPYIKNGVEYSVPEIKAPESDPTHYALVLYDGLNVRNEPSISGNDLGDMAAGVCAAIFEIIDDGDDVWLKIGVDRYIAARHNGKIYIKISGRMGLVEK